MIAVESFKKFRIVDLGIIIVLSGIWFLLSLVVNLLDPQISYILNLLVLIFLMSFIVYLVRKAGSATLFFLISGLISYGVNDFGVTGFSKVLLFVLAGIIFELVFLIFKLEIKNVQVDVVLGSGISSASIPFLMGIMLSSGVVVNMGVAMLNLILLSFFVGVIGSVLSFLLWYKLKTSKMVLKFEYMQSF